MTTPARLPDVVDFQPDEQMSRDEWIQFGTVLSTVHKGMQWAVGDWINFGRKQFHDGLDSGVKVMAHMETSTLVQYSDVARRFPPERRLHLDELDWTHYRVVANHAFFEEEEDQIFRDAVENRWSSRVLEQKCREHVFDRAAIAQGKKTSEELREEKLDIQRKIDDQCRRYHTLVGRALDESTGDTSEKVVTIPLDVAMAVLKYAPNPALDPVAVQ